MKGTMKSSTWFGLTLVALCGLWTSAPFTSQTAEPPRECNLTTEDYAVFSAVLMGRGKPEDPEEEWRDKPDLILSDTTASGPDVKGPSGLWGFRSAANQKPAEDTVRNFDSRAKNSCQLKSLLDPAISHRLITKDELNRIFRKGVRNGWEEFYKRYPKSSGYWDFSPVGYNSKGDEALVYISHYCGGRCGTGHLVLLTKENGHWVVRNRVMLWIS